MKLPVVLAVADDVAAVIGVVDVVAVNNSSGSKNTVFKDIFEVRFRFSKPWRLFGTYR